MPNVLSCKPYAFCALCTFYIVNFVDLFYPDGAMRHIAKSNLLNEIEIEKFAIIFNVELGLGISVCCFLPAMHAGCDSISSFPRIRKMTIFQTLKTKIDELTNMISLTLFRKSVTSIQ